MSGKGPARAGGPQGQAAATLIRTPYKPRIAFIAAGVLLATTTYVWADHFVFSKVFFVPEWAKPLPAAHWFPSYMAGVALLPAVVLPRDVSGAVKAAAGSLVLAPVGALAAHWEKWESGNHLVANAAFNFAWIALWYCLPAATVLLATRAIVDALRSKRG